MKLQTHLLAGLLACLLGLAPSAVEAAGDNLNRPNFLVILADDMGFSDAGCYGGEIHTPNIDSLAAGGLRFTQGHNTGRCWPSRAALLTGYYAQQVRRDTIPGQVDKGNRPHWAPLLPDRLKPLGYRNYHSGKWHLDGPAVAQGFDRSYMILDQDRFFWPTRHALDDEPLPPVEKDAGFYATIAIADHAVEVLRDHAANNAGEPFFHYVAFTSPHFPLHALQEDIDRYRQRYLVGWDKIRQERYGRLLRQGLISSKLSPRMPDVTSSHLSAEQLTEQIHSGEIGLPVAWDELTDDQKRFQATKMAIHAAMIDRMDQEIGHILDQLKAMGAWHNTLVFFASDNGASAEILNRGDKHQLDSVPGSGESYLCLGPGWATAANTPFRFHKTWVFEGGTATPFILHWPAGIAEPGGMRRQTAHLIDVAPALLELAGGRWSDHPTAKDGPAPPGVSLAEQLKSNPPSLDRGPIYWRHSGTLALREGDWKIVKNRDPDSAWNLYNLAKDCTETNDLADRQPERVQRMADIHAEIEAGFMEYLDLPDGGGAKAGNR